MELIKRNKGKMIASSIVILLPMLIGIFGQKLLPEELAVHWGLNGDADGFMRSSVVFFVFPAIMLVFHWLCMILTAVLDQNAGQNKKMFGLMFWIMPMFSLVFSGIMFAAALGTIAKIPAVAFAIFGVLFVVLGNYMPKTAQNLTLGIKIKWTLANEENWNATHRFAGKVYVVMGLLSLAAMPLPMKAFPFVLLGIVLVAVFAPVIYSYCFYKKQIREGKATKQDYQSSHQKLVKNNKIAVIVLAVMIPLIMVFVIVLMFTGKIETSVGKDALTLDATYWSELTVKYEEIDSVEYRENGVDGVRMSGFGSGKLLLGHFQNEEFGNYTRYTYTGDAPCIVLTVNEKIIVISAENEQSTKELYENLLAKISK